MWRPLQNEWIRLFSATPVTDIGSSMALTDELSDFQRGTVIGCRQVSSSNFCPGQLSAVIVNCKRLGVTTAQLRSGRPHKLTEWDR
jgi:hypothetical protein